VVAPGRTPAAAVRVRFVATVSDLATVQRLLMMLVGRRHPITRFEATETADGRWLVTLDCADGDPQLLLERLRRSPSVLGVRVVDTPEPTGAR
jgi:hypothetical protein